MSRRSRKPRGRKTTTSTTPPSLTPATLKLRSGHYDLSTVRVLNLSHSNLDSVAGVGACCNLEELYVVGNALRGVAEYARLDKLRVLDASHNRICDLEWMAGGPIELLKVLSLAGNGVADLDAVVATLAPAFRLDRLDFAALDGSAGNPIVSDPAYTMAIRSALPHLKILDGMRLKYASVYKTTALEDLFPDGEVLDLPHISDPWLDDGFFPSLPPITGPEADAIVASVEVASLPDAITELAGMEEEADAMVCVAAQQINLDPTTFVPTT